jgi:hypothetical protein
MIGVRTSDERLAWISHHDREGRDFSPAQPQNADHARQGRRYAKLVHHRLECKIAIANEVPRYVLMWQLFVHQSTFCFSRSAA